MVQALSFSETVSGCQSTSPSAHISTVPTGQISVKFENGVSLVETYDENPNLVKIKQKYQAVR